MHGFYNNPSVAVSQFEPQSQETNTTVVKYRKYSQVCDGMAFKVQQESVVRAKRGKSVGDSQTSATSLGSKREKKKSKVYQRKVQEISSKRFIAVKGYKSV